MKSQMVLTSLRPYLILMKYFGLLNVDLSDKLPKIITKSGFTFILHFLLMQCIPIGFNYLMISSFELSYNNKQMIIVSEMLWRLIAISTCIMVNVQSIIQVMSSRKIVNVVKLINEFDEKAHKIGMLFDYFMDRKHIKWTIVALLSLAPAYALMTYSFMYHQFRGTRFLDGSIPIYVRTNLSIQYGLLMGSLLVIQFISFILVIKRRFIMVNQYLIFQNSKIDAHYINDLLSYLYDSIEGINSALTMNLLLTMMFSLINVVFCIFTSLTFIFNPELLEYNSTAIHVLSNLTWIAENLFVIMIICHHGSSLTKTAELTQDIILKMIVKSRDENYNNELRCLLFQMKNRNTKVENVFFTIDWKSMAMVSKHETFI